MFRITCLGTLEVVSPCRCHLTEEITSSEVTHVIIPSPLPLRVPGSQSIEPSRSLIVMVEVTGVFSISRLFQTEYASVLDAQECQESIQNYECIQILT